MRPYERNPLFKRTTNPNEAKLNSAITRTHISMVASETDSDEYQRLLTQLERLQALKPEKASRQVSTDAIVGAVANLIGILIIVNYERENVMTTKAMNFWKKPS